VCAALIGGKYSAFGPAKDNLDSATLLNPTGGSATNPYGDFTEAEWCELKHV
jgi:hypothetical protein